MRIRRNETFEALVVELGKALGWREDERVINGCTFARDLDGPLSVAADLIFEADEETGRPVLGGVMSVRCVPAQELLDAIDSPASAVIERWLVTDADEYVAVELSPDLPVKETARELSALIRRAGGDLAAEAGTVDDFLGCVAADADRAGEVGEVTAAVLAVSGRAEEARAALAGVDDAGFVERFTAWLAGEYVAPEPVEPAGPSWADAVARTRARREALAAMERLGPSAGVDARRAVLVAELAARGVEETPYWIERRAARERLEDAAGLSRLVRDAVRVFRSIGGDEEVDDGEPASAGGRGPWRRVTLAPGADAALGRAYEAATRIGDLAMVTVRLRSSPSAAPPAVFLDGVEVGCVEDATGAWDDVAVHAQIGRLPSYPPYLLQLQLP